MKKNNIPHFHYDFRGMCISKQKSGSVEISQFKKSYCLSRNCKTRI